MAWNSRSRVLSLWVAQRNRDGWLSSYRCPPPRAFLFFGLLQLCRASLSSSLSPFSWLRAVAYGEMCIERSANRLWRPWNQTYQEYDVCSARRIRSTEASHFLSPSLAQRLIYSVHASMTLEDLSLTKTINESGSGAGASSRPDSLRLSV